MDKKIVKSLESQFINNLSFILLVKLVNVLETLLRCWNTDTLYFIDSSNLDIRVRICEIRTNLLKNYFLHVTVKRVERNDLPGTKTMLLLKRHITKKDCYSCSISKHYFCRCQYCCPFPDFCVSY